MTLSSVKCLYSAKHFYLRAQGMIATVETFLPVASEIDHVGIAVRSIAAACEFYALLGLTPGVVETVEREQVRVSMIEAGETRLELLEATAEDSVIGRFVAKRGEGLHHVAVRVADVDATFARLTNDDVRLASAAVCIGAGGHRYFFVHPAGTGGVLLEVVGS